ncbi:MAG: PP2C family protein-serine/threonine phosphatase, partial [Synechococcus sp.]
AFDSVEDIVRGLDAGADDFLTKPPEISELKARIRTGVRSYELKRELQRKTQELEAGLRATANYIRSVLPPPHTSHILSFSSEWQPCPQLGGTGIVGHWLNEDALIFGVLETAHSGIEAALQVAQLMSAIQCTRMSDLALSPPDRVLVTLQQQIAEQFQDSSRALNIWYGIFSPGDQQLTYVCAGHIKAVIVDSHGQVTHLASQEARLGMMPAVPNQSLDRLTVSTSSELATYTVTKQPLNSGNTLYLIGSSLSQRASAESNQDIQWLLDAETEAEAGIISEDGILTAAADNLRGQLGVDTFDGDLSLVRLRVH